MLLARGRAARRGAGRHVARSLSSVTLVGGLKAGSARPSPLACGRRFASSSSSSSSSSSGSSAAARRRACGAAASSPRRLLSSASSAQPAVQQKGAKATERDGHPVTADMERLYRRSELDSIKYAGRQGVSGVVATVFGATGFMGRYVVEQLGDMGSQVIVPFRGHGSATRHLKVMGDLGQVVHLPMESLDDEETIRKAVSRSNVVINLIGTLNLPTEWRRIHARLKRNSVAQLQTNVHFAERLARICAESGVERLVHVSAAGASASSELSFLQTKAAGEVAVREQFPEAVLIRPTHLFGNEDALFNMNCTRARAWSNPIMSAMDGPYRGPTRVWRGGKTHTQPVYVFDVAQGVVRAALSGDAPGSIYELGGPEVLELGDLVENMRSRVDPDDNAELRVYGEPYPGELAASEECFDDKYNEGTWPLYRQYPIRYDLQRAERFFVNREYVLTPEDAYFMQSIVAREGVPGIKTFKDLGMQPDSHHDYMELATQRYLDGSTYVGGRM